MFGQQQFNMRLVMIGIVTIGLLGFLVDRLLLVFQKRLLWWKTNQGTRLAAVTQIVFNAVTKFFGSPLAVRQVSLAVEQGSFTVLVGPLAAAKARSFR